MFHLLAYLLAHRDRVVPRQELCEYLWPKQFVSDAALDACLAQARRAVGDIGRSQRVIQTRHSYGYRFVAAVEVHDDPAGDDGHATSPPPHASAGVEPATLRASTAVGPAPGTEGLSDPPVPPIPVRLPSPPVRVGERKVVTVLVCTLANAAAWALRLGLHTGPILMGPLGQEGRMTFTPVGETTHLASWLCQQAASGTILVSEATARLVQDAVCLEPGPPLPSPRHSHPDRAYKVLGLGRRRAPLLEHETRPLSPFVGRGLELATLRALLRQVEGGQGQVVGIVGEPGMGKTRLIYEFWQGLRSTRVTYLEGRCVSYGQAIPYRPLQDIVRQACRLSEVENSNAITALVHQPLQERERAAAEEALYLLHLLGMPEAMARLAGVSPQTIRLRTFAALHQLLLRQSQRQPLLVVVENLHWIDPTSQEYLAELVERLAGLPLLLVVTCRSGYRPPWMDRSYATQLTLPRLSPEDSQRVVQAVLPALQLPDRLLQDIVGRAAGNPLFLEELAWAVKEHGGEQLPSDIPTTVQAILTTRIDRLPPGAKQLLQTAAVIGLEIPRPLLQAVAGWSEAELGEALQHLRAAEFLYETHMGPEAVYTFKHALTHEVAYGSLLQERRRALHAHILASLESCYPARLTEQAERLAHHAFRGEVWDKAVTYLHQAGTKAVQRSAHREAMAFFEEALRALQPLPESRDTLEQAIDLRLDLRAAFITTREFGRLLTHLGEAETMAQTLGDDRRLGRIYCYMANFFQQRGDHGRGIEFGQRALAMAMPQGDFETQVQTQYFLGQVYYALGDYRQAMKVVRRNVASLRGDLLREHFSLTSLASVSSRAVLVRCLAEVGAFAEGIICGEEALHIAEASDHSHSCFLAYLRVGGLYLRKGDVHHAMPLLERGLRRWQAYNLQSWFPTIASALGLAHIVVGQVAHAMPLLEQAFVRATALQSMFDLSLAAGRLSEAFLLAGRMPEASALAGRAHEHAQTHKERGHEAWALRLLGEIAVRQEPLQSAPAEGYYRQALALAQELGMRPLQAHCHLGLGTLYGKVGRPEQAHAALSTAIDLYHTMDMTFWLPQAEAALAQVGSSLA